MTQGTKTSQHERGAQSRREARQREEALAHLVLLRHGEPDWFPAGDRAVDDAGLTHHGQQQASAAAREIAKGRVDAVYVSPLRRAQETAAPLAALLGRTPVVVPAFAEIGIEGATGLSQVEVDHYFLEAMRRPLGEHWEGWPRGESFRDFHARVSAGLEEVLKRHGMTPTAEHDFTVWDQPTHPATIVIVGHGGTNSVILTHLLDIRPVPWEWMRFESELAAYSVLQARPLGQRGCIWSLQNFNEVDHLRAAKLR